MSIVIPIVIVLAVIAVLAVIGVLGVVASIRLERVLERAGDATLDSMASLDMAPYLPVTPAVMAGLVTIAPRRFVSCDAEEDIDPAAESAAHRTSSIPGRARDAARSARDAALRLTSRAHSGGTRRDHHGLFDGLGPSPSLRVAGLP